MNLDDVQRIAHLSRLELNQAEAEAVLPQLQAIFASLMNLLLSMVYFLVLQYLHFYFLLYFCLILLTNNLPLSLTLI